MSAQALSARDRGIQLLREGSVAESVGFLLQAITEEPSDVDLRLYLALAYAHEGNLDQSIDVLEEAVYLSPTSAKVHYNLGVAYHKGHNLTQAKDEYLRALGLDPSYIAAKNALDTLPHMQENGSVDGNSQPT
jgi:Tfp pilus assembly protein PilF